MEFSQKLYKYFELKRMKVTVKGKKRTGIKKEKLISKGMLVINEKKIKRKTQNKLN